MSAAANRGAGRRRRKGRDAMEWLLIEALCALLVAVLIVAWTMWPARRKPPARLTRDRGDNG